MVVHKSNIDDDLAQCSILTLLTTNHGVDYNDQHQDIANVYDQGCIFRLACSHPEMTEDNVLTSAYVKIFRTATRNAVNKSV